MSFQQHKMIQDGSQFWDGAAWHKSGTLQIFPNLELMFIPPYIPEINPIEQIWRELRARGFHNEVFQTLEKAVDRLCNTICNLTAETIHSITCRSWIVSCILRFTIHREKSPGGGMKLGLIPKLVQGYRPSASRFVIFSYVCF